MVLRGSVALFCLLALVIPAFGQTPSFEGEEITVAGRRPQHTATAAAYVTVLTREDLRRLGAVTVGDALGWIPEAVVRTAGAGPGGSQQASIRGSTPQQVLVLLDGVPLNATQPFGVNLSSLSTENVERIEVLRGPYSAIYGSGALGGVIAVTTRADTRPSLSVGAGSRPDGRWAFRAGGAAGVWAWGLAAEALTTVGERRNDDAQRHTGALWFRYAPDPSTSLTLSAHATSAVSGIAGSSTFPTPEDRLRDGRTVVRLTWRHEGDGGAFHELRVWRVGDEFRYAAPGFRSDTAGATWGAEWQQARPLGRGVLTWGLDWQQARYDYREASLFGGDTAFVATTSTTAAYVQYDVAVGDATYVGAGVRYDVSTSHGGQANPRLGFVHFLSRDLRLRGGVGRTFRSPTFGELFYPGCSDPGLRPETAWSADLGIEARLAPTAHVRLNAFYTDARDLIVGGCAPRNVGSARILGMSAELAARWAERWTIDANVTWTDGIDRATGEPILRLPPVTANLTLRYRLSDRSTLALAANFVSHRPDLDFSSFPAARVTLASHATAGLRFEQSFGDVRLRAGVDNLFDASYETLRGYPGSRRSAWIVVEADY